MVATNYRKPDTGYRIPETSTRGAAQEPRPTPVEKGARIWRLVHSYRMGEGYADITAVAEVPGGCLVRTTTRSARGQSQALVFVPGMRAQDWIGGAG